eukprot:354848-Chlamydomonas_euryale.AAC.3
MRAGTRCVSHLASHPRGSTQAAAAMAHPAVPRRRAALRRAASIVAACPTERSLEECACWQHWRPERASRTPSRTVDRSSQTAYKGMRRGASWASAAPARHCARAARLPPPPPRQRRGGICVGAMPVCMAGMQRRWRAGQPADLVARSATCRADRLRCKPRKPR